MNFKQALIAHLQGERVQKRLPASNAWESFIRCDDTISLFDALQDGFADNCSFRIAPRTILCNGVEVPAPERVLPDHGVVYFSPDPMSYDMFSQLGNFDQEVTRANLKRGLVYLNKEDAIARAKAMLITQEVK